MHLTTGWVGAYIGWDISCDGWILFPPATDRFPYGEDFWVDLKEKEKGFFPKEKGKNKGAEGAFKEKIDVFVGPKAPKNVISPPRPPRVRKVF